MPDVWDIFSFFHAYFLFQIIKLQENKGQQMTDFSCGKNLDPLTQDYSVLIVLG